MKASGLTQEAFDKLLANLDPKRDEAGQRYEYLRRRLVKFFEWRRCPAPEDHADEALNRIARRLDEGSSIDDVPTYAAGIARMVVLEIRRQNREEDAARSELYHAAHTASDPLESNDRWLDCLEICLRSLPAPAQTLIAEYYRAEKRVKIERRKALANRLGMSLEGLRVRAHRIRAKLAQCVTRCVDGQRLEAELRL